MSQVSPGISWGGDAACLCLGSEQARGGGGGVERMLVIDGEGKIFLSFFLRG